MKQPRPRRAARPAGRDGRTEAAKEATPGPRLPHERDQSADSQAGVPPPDDEVGAQAHADVERGLVDTDRGPVLDQTYRERVKPHKR